MIQSSIWILLVNKLNECTVVYILDERLLVLLQVQSAVALPAQDRTPKLKTSDLTEKTPSRANSGAMYVEVFEAADDLYI
jgi:hypothetical protein